VLDLGQVWAGPLLGQYLGDMGAEVIRVESAMRQGMQSGARTPVTDPEDPRAWLAMARNRRSITLNLASTEGAELFKALVAHSDVLLENFSPRAMRKLGLDYPVLARVNPRLIMASLSAAGQYGPWHDLLTYGPSLTALYGMKSLLAYHDDPAIQEDVADLDPTAATYAFFAILSALEYRERTGLGQYIDMAQGEAGFCSLGEAVMDYFMNGRVARPMGNRHPAMAPHGIYRCKDEGADSDPIHPSSFIPHPSDEWVAIAVETDDEWRALCRVMGEPAWSGDTRFADTWGRLHHQDELDERLSAWTCQYSSTELTERLQAAGVAAFPVLTALRIVEDEHLRARRRDVQIAAEHLDRDLVVYGIPWKLSGTPGAIRRPVVPPGTDNGYVFGELLHLPESEIRRLIDEHVLY
jgi:benzylsuccinate CoA-transferase BbsF subunit